MSLLKDVRLLLILALAVLCLFALKMCSTAYQVDGQASSGSADSATDKIVSSTGASDEAVADDAKTETPSLASTESSTQTESTESSTQTESTESAAQTESAESTSEESSATTTVAASESEQSENEESQAAGEEPAAETTEMTESTVKEETSTNTAVAAGEQEQSETEEAQAAGTEETATGEATETAATEPVKQEGDDTVANADGEGEVTDDTSSIAEGNMSETSQIAIAKPEPMVIEKIELRAHADTGDLIGDFKTDVQTVQSGIDRYSEKLEKARGLLDSLGGAGQ